MRTGIVIVAVIPTETLQRIDLPLSSAGAPLPHVVADEHRLLIGYIVHVVDPDWDGLRPRSVGPDSGDNECALLTVEDYLVVQFGPPDDEAIAGHRLYKLGLKPYSSFEVLNSKWIADLEIANRVHHRHRPEAFANYRHIILTFHDSTLEFIARSFDVRLVKGSIRSVVLGALMN